MHSFKVIEMKIENVAGFTEVSSCLMNCFTRRDTVLKGPTHGWTHTGNRFDTTQTSWEGWNYIAFILIFLKKIIKREKSR